MDPLIRDESGQSLVVAALILGVAAFAVTAMHGAQERLVDGLRDQRAGEAAVVAAGSAVASLHHARVASLGRPLSPEEIERFAAEPDVLEAARAAAARMAEVHRARGYLDVAVRSFGVEIEVHVKLAGRSHIALLAPPA